MKLFKEYLLDITTYVEQSIYLPKDADVVNVSFTDKGLMLLAIVEPVEYATELPELRIFKICVNDENFYADTVKYIGSFESAFGVKHVIEIIKEN